jgi:maltose O-acetyltransferase
VADTERARMLRGELYLASDPELTTARRRARRLWHRFNTLSPVDPAAGHAVLAELLGGVGADAWIEAPFYCDYGSQITWVPGCSST